MSTIDGRLYQTQELGKAGYNAIPSAIWTPLYSKALYVESAPRASGRRRVRETWRSMSWSRISFHVQAAERKIKDPMMKRVLVRRSWSTGGTGSWRQAAMTVV